MQYFFMQVNPHQVGHVPQQNGWTTIPGGLSNFYAFTRGDMEGDLIVPETVFLHHRSKFTDYFSFNIMTYPFLTLSDRFAAIFPSFRTDKFRSFPFKVTKRTKSVPCNLIFTNVTHPEFIDFERSLFFCYESLKDENRQDIAIKSLMEYQKALTTLEPGYAINAWKLELNPAVIDLDIFRLPRGLPIARYIVSEKFADAVTAAGFTGVLFEPFVFDYTKGERYKQFHPD